MNTTELKVAMIRAQTTIEQLAADIKISKEAFYRKMRGTSEFTREEIQNISEVLNLSGEDIISIFFAKEVS